MKKKTLIIAISVLLVAVMSVGATLAYFTAMTEPVNNVFTLGSVSAELSEDAWTGDHKIMPGDTEPKDPTITLTTGSEPAWAFITIKITDAAALKTAVGGGDILIGIATNLASGWTLMNTPAIQADDTITYIYGYNTYLELPGSAATTPIFTAITLPGTVDGSPAYTDLVAGFTITAQAYLIQKANVATLAIAYGFVETEFGF